MKYNAKFAVLQKRDKDDEFDGSCFVVGILCFLNQFNPTNKELFLDLLSQYIRTTISNQLNKKSGSEKKNPGNLPCFIGFFEEFFRFSDDGFEVSPLFVPNA